MAIQANLVVNLALYFVINLSLSTCNKLVLQRTPLPWLMTALHATFTTLGCLICLQQGYFRLTKLTRSENGILLLFSTLFTINIAMSNLSLALVSLAFHQATRSTSPIFVVLIDRLWYKKTYEPAVYLALVAMSLGIAMATYGDYYFTMLGFSITVLGVMLASIKTVATNRLMTGHLRLHPLELLLRMCPLAAVQSFLCSIFVNELHKAPDVVDIIPAGRAVALLVFNGGLAFAQNLSSFHTNKVVGAMAISVCANLKQAFTILLAVMMFHIKVGLLNGLGMTTTLSGSAYWCWIKIRVKETRESEDVIPRWKTVSNRGSLNNRGSASTMN